LSLKTKLAETKLLRIVIEGEKGLQFFEKEWIPLKPTAGIAIAARVAPAFRIFRIR